MSSRSLLVLPDDSSQPFIDAVASAQQTLRIKMFVFEDPDMIAAVIAAKKRGVDVRVMLNPARRSGEEENAETRKRLLQAGIAVADSCPSFELTHEKSMVVDEQLAFVMSLNWATRNFTETRDYAIVTEHAHEIAEIITCFEADWHRKDFTPGEAKHLIWCNSNGRERFAHFIDQAKGVLWLQNERYQDAVIIERVVRAIERGVKVHILARPPHTLKKDKLIEGVGGLRIMNDVGAKVHKPKHLRLHGKMMLSHGDRAIIGSINLAPGSFDGRRELAIDVNDEPILRRLEKIAEEDWKHSEPLDLSDKGLMKDLAKRGKEAGAADLVLDVKPPKKPKADGRGAKPERRAAKDRPTKCAKG